MYAGIMFSFIGLIASVAVLVAESRNIIVDTIMTSLGVPVWEFAFIIYLMFFSAGVIIEMFELRRIRDMRIKFTHVSLTLVSLLICMFILQSSGIGILSASMTNMLNEFYEWSLYLGLVIVVYIIMVFIQ